MILGSCCHADVFKCSFSGQFGFNQLFDAIIKHAKHHDRQLSPDRSGRERDLAAPPSGPDGSRPFPVLILEEAETRRPSLSCQRPGTKVADGETDTVPAAAC